MTRDEVLAIIKKAEQEGWEELDLCGQGLTELPEDIGRVAQLKVLKLGYNPETGGLNFLEHLPDTLGQLTNLQHLDISYNNLGRLPEWLGQLANLQYLDLSWNNLRKLPEGLGHLTNLQYLDIGSNNLGRLPEWLGQLANLQHLDLSRTNLERLPEWLSQLTNLQHLDLSSNNLGRLPEWLARLTNLQHLDLSVNNLGRLPEWLNQLTNLQHLDLRENNLGRLSEGLAQLSNLQHLNLSGNNLETLPEWLAQLSNLQHLDIGSNNLETLPEWLAQLPHLQWLYIGENPIIEPSPEVLGEALTTTSKSVDLEAVRRYYAQLKRAGQAYFYEAKLLLVGEGGVGKTSLATKLLDVNAPLPEEDDSTEGIDILSWPFPVPADKLPDALRPLRQAQGTADIMESSLNLSKGTAYQEAPLRQAQGAGLRQAHRAAQAAAEETMYQAKIWDFGGQSVYYATHQFFLSKRSVYVLLADTRREHYNFYDWLRMQETFGEDSPVILMLNKNRKRGLQVNIENLPYLQNRFPNLDQIIELDLSQAANEEKWPELLAHLKKHLLSLDHIGRPRPKTWVEIRKALQANERDSISRREFLNICQEQGIPDPLDALQLSDYLHNVGDILHFEADTILSDIVILKPTWALDAVYRVLHDEEIVAEGGRFTLDQLRHLWHEAKYENHRPQLLRLMEKFKLCYPLPGEDDTYIAPQLLTPIAPTYQWPGGPDDLQFRYRYPLFMPRGILSRAIVSLHHRIKYQSMVWRSGVILTDKYAAAELLELRGEREIRLRVTGRPKRDLFMEIIRALDDLHRAFSRKLKYDKLVPCRCDTCRPLPDPHFYRLGKLLERLSNRKETIECDNSPYHEVQIRSLIDDDILRQEKESGRIHHGDIYNINIKDTKESAMSFGRSGSATANN